MWFIVIIAMILVTLLGLNLWSASSSLFMNLVTFSGYFLLLAKLCYDHNTRLHLLVKKIYFFFKSDDVIWSFELRSNSNFEKKKLEDIYQYLKQFDSSLTTLRTTPSIKIIRVNTFVLELRLSDDCLILAATDHQMSYNRAKNIFDNELSDLIDGLVTRLGASSYDCFVSVAFKDNNPFSGLLIKGIDKKGLLKYDITLLDGSNKVMISKDRITFYSPSIKEVNKQAHHFLSLSYTPFKRLKKRGAS